MKLMVDGLMGQQSGTTYSQSGNPGLFQAPWSVATRFDRVSYIEARLFATDYWAPSQINRNSLGLKLTHAITSQTYYEVTFNTFGSHYDTAPGALRDTSKTYKFGNNYYVDESPFGFWPYSPGDNSASPAVNDMRVSGGMSTSRDSSFIRYYKLKFDITSQLDEYNEIKSGFEVQYTHNHTSYGRYDAAFQTTNVYQEWTTYPIQAAFYIQDKLEFEGMVANVGVRFDYSNPNGSWWQYSTYDPAFAAENEDQRGELLKRTELEGQLTVSPRLGVSFPVSQNSKIFFNYGHFRDLPTPEHLYLRRSSFTGQLTRIANPDMPFPKTVAYELGYEQNLLDQYLLRLTGYYKDISNENTTVDYISRDGKVDYSISEPATYRDIRGFELSLRKNRGDWVRGFVNYTYMVSSFGRFGWGQYYQSPTEQRQYQRTSDWHIQIQPVPQPYARANIDFFTPMEFGPEFMGMFPLEDIRFNILATWSSGDYFTWTNGQDIQGYNNNVQWKDNWNVNIRLSKEFNFTDAISLQLFVSVNNVFNFKQFSQYGFVDVYDYRRYMRSLHLPAGDVRDDFGYVNIPGDDKPGDYRSVGAEFTPIEAVNNVYEVSSSDIKQGVIYWDQSTGKYMQMAEDGSDWQQVSSSRMDKIKENKSYIDMPNLKFNTFLNPRDIFWGLRMNINF
jgi:outer membrane receptor protein involved in Fe transport